MHYNLKGTNLAINPEIRRYLEKKLGSLDPLLRDEMAARADVELEYAQSEEKTYRAEVTLHDHSVLRAEATAKTLRASLDAVVQELYMILTKFKKKRIHVLRRGASKVKQFLTSWRPA